MANAANRAALQSQGGGDVFAPPDHLLVIAEEDPSHPNHHEHMERVRPDDPENQALLASFREFGWPKAFVIAVHKDGKRFVVSDGRRRLTFVRIENARRKKEKDARGPIRPRIVLDDEPLVTEGMANAHRKLDPPLVIGRRFREQRDSLGSAGKAAALLGISLAEGNALDEILKCPNPDLHLAVNRRQIAVDVALRAVKAGSDAVRKVLAKARGTDGKVDAKAAKAAVKTEVAARPKARPAKELEAVEQALRARGPSYQNAAELLAWARGGEAPAYVQQIVDGLKAGGKSKPKKAA